MAIYHLSTKPVSRSSGRTATASIAYRAGIAIKDERTGKEHDYTKRGGVVATQLHTPNNLKIDRPQLWNLAEATEKRSNSRTAREIVVNLPHELPPADRSELVNDFAKDLADKYGVAVDVAIHSPDKEGDNRNHHAHIMLTTRKLERLESGRIALTDKSQLEMSNTQLKERDLPSAKDELKLIRKQWADMTNERLEHAQIDARIDHRSHAERGLDQLPTQKLGWEASAMERKGIATDKGDYNRMVNDYNQALNEIAVIDKSLSNLKEQREQSNDRTRERLERAVKLTGSAAKNTNWADERARQVNEITSRSQRQTDQAEQAIDRADRVIATHQQIKQQSEVTAVTESITDKFEQSNKIYLEYAKKTETTAQAILGSQLQALKDRGAPLQAEFEKLRDNKPWTGKEKWEKDKQNALNAFNAVKERHGSIKDKGITDEHREQARQHIAKHEPLYHSQAQQAIKIVIELNKEKQENKAQQHGADFHAQQGKTYSGKILRSDENGIVQQTRNGTVYHPAMDGIEQGKSYSLTNEGNSYAVQQQHEYKTPEKSLDRDRGVDR